jgi:WD40 repeat protein
MLLAIANGDGTVSLRDARSGDRIGPFLHNHEDGVRAVAFSSDGALLASTGVDGRVVLWDTSPEDWEARACAVASRNLTLAEWRRYLGQRPYQRTCPDLPDGSSE